MLATHPADSLLDACPSCGGHLLVADAEPIIAQRVEIATAPLIIHEHRSHPGWCPACRKEHYAPFPLDIERGGLAGPRLTTVIAYLKGACHASFSTVRKFVRDVLGVTISRGQLAKIIGKVSKALEAPCDERLRDLPG
jgi:Zn-finger nucleic acid-binding protein